MDRTHATATAAQQAAIANVRARYERGALSYEAFRRALDAIVLARTPDECQAILRALPAEPAASLAALDPPAAPPAPGQGYKRIDAILGQTKKLRRSWRLAPYTEVVARMGEVKLDLGVAELPPRARLRVSAVMGGVTIYVPRNLRVRVRSRVLLGETSALGEHTSGIFTSGHEQHTPEEPPVADVEIEAFVFMGNVHVILTDGPMLSVGDLVRDALSAVVDGFRRGWLAGSDGTRGAQSRSLDAGRPR